MDDTDHVLILSFGFKIEEKTKTLFVKLAFVLKPANYTTVYDHRDLTEQLTSIHPLQGGTELQPITVEFRWGWDYTLDPGQKGQAHIRHIFQ